jgi:hypothetical protein
MWGRGPTLYKHNYYDSLAVPGPSGLDARAVETPPSVPAAEPAREPAGELAVEPAGEPAREQPPVPAEEQTAVANPGK